MPERTNPPLEPGHANGHLPHDVLVATGSGQFYRRWLEGAYPPNGNGVSPEVEIGGLAVTGAGAPDTQTPPETEAHELVFRNIGFVIKFAADEYRKRPEVTAMDLDDFIQIVATRAVICAPEYDPKLATFPTFVASRARQSIRDIYNNARGPIRVPRSHHEALKNGDNGPKAASAYNMGQVESLDAPFGYDGNTTLASQVADRAVPSPEKTVIDTITEELWLGALREALDSLPDERQRTVLVAYFGLDGQEPLTHEGISTKLFNGSVTAETIRNWKNKGLETLRTTLASHAAMHSE